jgi:serine/threonine-protein kinase SRPK3
MWNIIAQTSLFEGVLSTKDDMTCQQISALGPLPAEWWEHFTNHGGTMQPAEYQYQNKSWEDRFEMFVQDPRIREGMPLFESSERDAFLAMLRSMLAYKPEERASAR